MSFVCTRASGLLARLLSSRIKAAAPLAYSKTLRVQGAVVIRVSVLECDNTPLFLPGFSGPDPFQVAVRMREQSHTISATACDKRIRPVPRTGWHPSTLNVPIVLGGRRAARAIGNGPALGQPLA